MFGLLEQEWFVVLRVSGGDCHVLFYLGQIFQGLTGQGSCVVLISLFILCRDRKMGIFHSLGFLYQQLSQRGSLVWPKHVGHFFFCVCMKILLLPLELSKFALYCFVSPSVLLSSAVYFLRFPTLLARCVSRVHPCLPGPKCAYFLLFVGR